MSYNKAAALVKLLGFIALTMMPVQVATQTVLCPGFPSGNYCDCDGDCTVSPTFCACPAAQQCCGSSGGGAGGGGGGTMQPCLDGYAARLGVTELPSTASADYKKLYCQYTKIDTSKGPIEIFGQSQLSSLQLYRARKILGFYLENIDCNGCYGMYVYLLGVSTDVNFFRNGS